MILENRPMSEAMSANSSNVRFISATVLTIVNLEMEKVYGFHFKRYEVTISRKDKFYLRSDDHCF